MGGGGGVEGKRDTNKIIIKSTRQQTEIYFKKKVEYQSKTKDKIIKSRKI